MLTELSLDGAVFRYSHNFAWLTGGARSFINMAVDGASSSLSRLYNAIPFMAREDTVTHTIRLLYMCVVPC